MEGVKGLVLECVSSCSSGGGVTQVNPAGREASEVTFLSNCSSVIPFFFKWLSILALLKGASFLKSRVRLPSRFLFSIFLTRAAIMASGLYLVIPQAFSLVLYIRFL